MLRFRVPKSQKPTKQVVKPFICLPYKGKEGEKIVAQFRSALTKALPSYVQPQFTYKGKKIGSYFRLKDKVAFDHQSGLVYAFKKGDYVGETKVRISGTEFTSIATRTRSLPYTSLKLTTRCKCPKMTSKFWIWGILIH